MERFRGIMVGVFKKIWNWLKGEEEVEAMKRDLPKYASGGYIKNAERYVAPRYYSEATSNNTAIRNNNDNFLMGAMVGYVIADSLNDSPSARDIEVPKSSNYESSYTPSSSSSYDSGNYSARSDSDSSASCSCGSDC